MSLATFIDGQFGTANDGGFLFLSPPLAVANRFIPTSPVEMKNLHQRQVLE
jgi:hypothetical protein